MKTTTLRKIWKCSPWKDMWEDLLEGLQKTEADDEPLPYSKIVEICGLQYALRATRAETDCQWVKELALKYAQRTKHLIKNPNTVFNLKVVEEFLHGKATLQALKAARIYASDAQAKFPTIIHGNTESVSAAYSYQSFRAADCCATDAAYEAYNATTASSKSAYIGCCAANSADESAAAMAHAAEGAFYTSCITNPLEYTPESRAHVSVKAREDERAWQEAEFLRVVG